MTSSALPRPRACALAAALLCGALPAAWAQARASDTPTATPTATEAPSDQPAENALPVVRARAEGERAGGLVLGYAARRSSTATRSDTPLSEVPQSISVITADQIRDQNAQNLQEVLRYSAGVRSEMYGLDNRGDWYSLRGGSDGALLLDGLRLPLSGSWGVVRSEPYAFERIEVLRGPSSVVAGQNGPGGVVNLISKRPQAESQRELGLQWGSNGHGQIQADVGEALDAEGRLRLRVVGLLKDSGTQVEHAFDRRRLLAPSLSWQLSPATRLTVYAEYQKDRSGNTNAFFPIEGTLRLGPQGWLSPHTFIGEPAWDTYGGERRRLGYEWEQQLSERWTLRQRLRQDRVDGRMRSMYANWWEGYQNAAGQPDAAGSYLKRTWYAADDRHRITQGDLQLEGRLQLGATRHTLLLGVDALRQRSSNHSWQGDATPLNVYAPVYGRFALPVLGPVDPSRTASQQWGLLLQDQIKFDPRWVLVAGLRHDRVRSDSQSSDGSQTRQRDSATSKSLGLVHLLDGGWSPYASYSESFEPVAGSDAAGRAFKPKRGRQLEAGLKWAPADQRLSASAALYRLKEKNRLSADPLNVGKQLQRGEVTAQGLELELKGSLPRWDLIASYSYTEARQTRVGHQEEQYLDKQLSGIPRHAASLWAVHRLDDYGLPGFKAGAGLRHVGRSSDGIDQTQTPGQTLGDLLLSWEQGSWQAALNVSNVGNKRYIASCLERGDCWYGTLRRAVASLSYRW